jgi:hypothetical protein
MALLGNNSDIQLKVTTKADNSGLDETESRLGRLGNAGSKLATAGKVAAVGLGVIGSAAIAAGGFALNAASQFETMNVALETAFQGNTKAAKDAGEAITAFAAKTPYELGEVMRGFIKLKNMGLDPSQKALTAYGDTASAMGKSLNDMVEAVADAATGEFERLKEFGIRASSQGDRVRFTFQGVTTEVGKNSKEIEQYLIKLGQTKFSGGMEAQSQTLAGKLSTLGDTFSLTMAKFAEDSGLMEVAKQALDLASETIENLPQHLETLGSAIQTVGEHINDFTGWVNTNRQAIEATAAVIGFALLPQMVAMAGRLVANTALWITHNAVALAGAIAQSYLFITSGWQTVGVLAAQGVQLGISTAAWIANNVATGAAFVLSGRMTAAFVASRLAMLAGGTAMGILTAAQWALNVALSANPIGLIVIAVAALSAGLIVMAGNWDKFKTAAVNAIKPVIDWISNLVGWLGKVTGLSGTVDTFKNIGKQLKIPGFAQGTSYAPGGMAVLGERGPELVNLPRGSQVVPAGQTQTMLSQARGLVIENFNMVVNDQTDWTFGLERLDSTLSARLG